MIFIPLLYFILANSFLVLITKKKFGITFPFTIMLSTIVVYVSGILFKNFIPGILLDLVVIPAIIIYLVANRKKKQKQIEDFKKNYFSNGFLIAIFVGIFFFIYDFRRLFIVWDELSHWGPMVKNLLNLNNFYSEYNSTLIPHRDYPPMISLYEMLCVKLSGGKYTEPIVASSLHMFNFILFLPAMSEIKTKKKSLLFLFSIVTIISYLLLILFFDASGMIYTIYIDYSVALLCSLGLYYIFITKRFNENHDCILLSILMVFLILSKDIGIPLYAVILFSTIISIMLNKKNYKYKDIFKLFVLFIIIPILFLLSWKLYIKPFNIIPEFDLGQVDSNLIKSFVFAGREPGVQYFYNYTRNTNLTSGIIQMTFLSGTIIGITILYLLYKYYKLEKDKMRNLIISLIVCHIGYYIMFLILITLAYRNGNNPFKGSLMRYLDTYLIILYGIVYMVFIYSNLKKNKNYLLYSLIVLGLLLSIQNVSRLNDIYPAYRRIDNIHSVYNDYANNIINNVPKKSKVFFLTSGDNVGQQYFIQYYLDEIKINDLYFCYKEFDGSFKNDNETLLNYIKEFDYFYLIDCNEEFIKKYSKYFDDIKENSIYKITIKKDKLKFMIEE